MDQPPPIVRPRHTERQPVFNAPPGTVLLCAAIVLAHVLRVLLPHSLQDALIERFAFVPGAFLAQFGGGGLVAGEFLTLVSYAFLHGDAMHLFLNAGLLLAFGSVVEWVLGTGRLLVLFFAACIVAALVQGLATGPAPVAVIGASGGVYGLLGAAVPFLFRSGVGDGRSNALVFIGVIMGLNLLIGLAGMEILPGPGIAWQAHIGGFFAGLIAVHLVGRPRH
ncbi:MAG: rhomboid family intramembrane serine protease [Alphaproteobacteria bacterium]